MSDISLDLNRTSLNYRDLLIVNNDLVLNDGQAAVTQNVLQRLQMFLGEWFLDNTIGLPYFQQILVKNPDQSKIDALFANQIMGTPGIIQLNTYSFKVNFTTRAL